MFEDGEIRLRAVSARSLGGRRAAPPIMRERRADLLQLPV